MIPVPEIDVLRALARLIHEYGPSVRAAAPKLGYDRCYLSMMLNQRAPVAKPLLDRMGYKRVKTITYEVKE